MVENLTLKWGTLKGWDGIEKSRSILENCKIDDCQKRTLVSAIEAALDFLTSDADVTPDQRIANARYELEAALPSA